MYVKIEDLEAVLNDENLKFGDVRANILGKLKPFETFNQEQVDKAQTAKADETKAEETAERGKPFDFKPRSGGFFDILQELADDLRKEGIEVPPLPFPNAGQSFTDLLRRRHFNPQNTITLHYDKQRTSEFFAGSISEVIKAVGHDFQDKFIDKFNGLPSKEILDLVRETTAENIKDHKSKHKADHSKRLQISFHLPGSIGKCDCKACTVTPLN